LRGQTSYLYAEKEERLKAYLGNLHYILRVWEIYWNIWSVVLQWITFIQATRAVFCVFEKSLLINNCVQMF
jgi:hypothetical protein